MITPARTGGSRRAAIALVLLILAPPAASARGQTAPPAPRDVARVRLLVDGEPTADPTLLRLIEIAAGASLSPVRVRETIVHLMALGRFADVVASADEADGRLTLTFAAASVPKVTAIVFRGDLGVPEGELRAAVVEQFSASPPVGRAGEIGRRLEALCRERGFLAARVTPRVQSAGRPDAAVLGFEMAAGPRVRLSAAAVDGEAGTSAAEVLERLGLRLGVPLDPVAIRRRATDFEGTLRARGYFEAEVSPQFTFADNGESASVRVVVDRGPLVTLVFRGDSLPLARQVELVPIEREGSVDEDLLEDGQRNVEDYFRSLGYRDAKVSYAREPSADRLRIVFSVTRGPQYKVSAVDITGNEHVPAADLRSGLRCEPGTLFVGANLDADAATVTERYRRLGFAEVTVTATSAPQSGPAPAGQALVAVRLDIVEGPRTLVGTVVVAGHARVPADAVNAAVSAATGQPYYQADVARDREAILLELLNRGYQSATVETAVTFSDDRSRADIRFLIQEGPEILVDHVLIVGNTRTSARTIEQELLVAPGQPLGLSSLVESQRRLIALGLFRRVSVTELPRGSDAAHDVLVTVEEAPPTTFSWGGGVEGSRRLVREGTEGGQSVERIDFAPRGFFELGRRNLWGKNRTINLFARASFRSKDPAEVTTATGTTFEPGGGYGLSEFRVQATYREPRVWGATSDLLVVGVSERGYRSSFNFDRHIGRAELVHRFSSGVSASGRFSIESTYLFEQRFNVSDKLLIDRLFPQVRLSILAFTLARDRRDDALDPASGTFVSMDGDLALRSLGSEVGYAKSFFQGFVYRRVPKTRLVFAAGARVGLATGFARRVVTLDEGGNPVVGPDGQPATTIVRSVPASERFYAGGSTTIRGFTNDRVGTSSTLDRDGFPLGGLGMVIANAELRFPVWRWIGAVAFVDVGNVFARVGEIAPAEFRAAFGLGMRVRWPVLPMIRLDVGINPDSRLFENGSREKSWAIYLGIGQAF